METKNFYDKFTHLCAYHRETQEQALRAVGMSRSCINHWQKGVVPTLNNRAKIARHFGIDPVELGTETRSKAKGNIVYHYSAPVRVGDKVYYVWEDEDGVDCEELIVTEVATKVFFHTVPSRVNDDFDFCEYTAYSCIGKDVFLTSAAAKREMNRREKERA